MPRIRKETSNRRTSHQRAKIKHKVAEGRKKAKKAAKKNPQWKSKQKKDIGIPNNFPFKDEVLAEVADARRKAVEEKQKRKDAAKAKRLAQTGVTAEPTDEDPASEGGDDEATAQETGIVTVGGSKAIRAGKGKGKRDADAMDEDEDATESPAQIDPTLVDLAAVIDRADALLCVLDARDPLAYRNTAIEEAGKPVVFVVTKTDLVPRETLSAWVSHLRASTTSPVVLFKAASAFVPAAPETTKTKQKQEPPVTDALGVDAVLAAIKSLNAKTVAVVGPSNAGKSALINSLAHRVIQPVYDFRTSLPGPTTTTRPTTISLPTLAPLTFIDTAGIIPLYASPETEEAERATDILLRARGHIERIKEPLPLLAVESIIARASAQDLMMQYNLPAFEGGSTTAFLNALARARNCLNKNALPDHPATAKIVLRDWAAGSVAWFTLPPNTVEGAATGENTADAAVLDACLSRKDLRRARGSLVVLKPGSIDTRKIDLHAKSGGDGTGEGRAAKRPRIEGPEDDEEDEEEDEDGVAEDWSDESGDDDDDEKEDEEGVSGYESDNNDTPVETPATRKRTLKAPVASVSKEKGGKGKKVTFAEPPPSKGKKTAPPPKAAATKAKAMVKASVQPKRVANTASAKTRASAASSDPDAYDFGSYFKG